MEQMSLMQLFNEEFGTTEKASYDALKKEIQIHAKKYHEDDAPDISDAEYDAKMRKLKEMEKEHPEWISSDSPTQVVGGAVKRTAKEVTHNVPMKSIDDIFSYEEIKEFVEKVHLLHPDATFSVEEKIDGLSCSLRYKRTDRDQLELVLAETRGNGFVGEDVTACALMVPDVKKILHLPYKYLEIRGEVYMTYADFERHNKKMEEEGKKTAANCRNLAAGTFRALDPSIVKERGLHMLTFNIQDTVPLHNDVTEHIEGMDMLKEGGVPVTYHEHCKTYEEVIAAVENIGKRRATLPYPIDGAVIKVNQLAYRKDFPADGKNTDGMKAYKYPPEEKEVTMLEIELSVGRTGRIAATGVTTTVRLCETNVNRVTLHNQEYIKEHKVGIGGKYLLYKSGDIIPKLSDTVMEPEEVFSFPEVCPVCKHKLLKDNTDYFCVNPSCPSQLVRTVSYYCSREALNIKALGETLVEALVNGGYVRNYADIYSLHKYREELIERGILGKEKNTDKILLAIEESKEKDAVSVLTGLGIRNVGKSTAATLMQAYGSIEKLMLSNEDELCQLPDIGEVTAACIVEFFADNFAVMEQLRAAGVNMTHHVETVDTSLAGLTFCVTGTLSSMGRKEVEELIVSHGGKVGGFSKSINYLIAGEKAGSKLTKAQENGIPVLSEDDFLEMLRGDYDRE